jgi:F-type H+-transporting ATPase subunit epsilon
LATFTLKVLNPKHVVFEGAATSVFLPGDRTEFEILAHHAPVVSMLRAGEVIVDWTHRIPIKKGMVRFLNDECVILVEEDEPRRGAASAGDGRPAADRGPKHA